MQASVPHTFAKDSYAVQRFRTVGQGATCSILKRSESLQLPVLFFWKLRHAGNVLLKVVLFCLINNSVQANCASLVQTIHIHIGDDLISNFQ